MGSLAHLLKNRFYIGEVTYRGEVYRGEHEAILSRDLFDAVQEKLAANAVARQVRLRGSGELRRLAQDRRGRLNVVAMDVTDAQSVREAATQLKDISIDVLINSAGIAGVPGQTTGNVDYESWPKCSM